MKRVIRASTELIEIEVTVGPGTDRKTQGQGYYYVYPERHCEILPKEIWNKFDVRKNKGAMHFPNESEAIERVQDEICDAYGYGYITDNQRRKYIEIFEKGKEAMEEPLESEDTAALDVLLRFMKQLRFEIEQDRFDALSPEEQAEEIKRSEENKKAWENHKKEIKKILNMEE